MGDSAQKSHASSNRRFIVNDGLVAEQRNNNSQNNEMKIISIINTHYIQTNGITNNEHNCRSKIHHELISNANETKRENRINDRIERKIKQTFGMRRMFLFTIHIDIVFF